MSYDDGIAWMLMDEAQWFTFHPPILGKLDERGRFRPLTRRERLSQMLVECLWPSAPTLRVSALDVERGTITMGRIP